MDGITDTNNTSAHQFLPVTHGTINEHTVNGDSTMDGHATRPQVNGKVDGATFTPIVICGMACHLPGEIHYWRIYGTPC